ncbi:MAG: flagellar hook-length control protein FliK [Pseudomonadota bacterium]
MTQILSALQTTPAGTDTGLAGDDTQSLDDALAFANALLQQQTANSGNNDGSGLPLTAGSDSPVLAQLLTGSLGALDQDLNSVNALPQQPVLSDLSALQDGVLAAEGAVLVDDAGGRALTDLTDPSLLVSADPRQLDANAEALASALGTQPVVQGDASLTETDNAAVPVTNFTLLGVASAGTVAEGNAALEQQGATGQLRVLPDGTKAQASQRSWTESVGIPKRSGSDVLEPIVTRTIPAEVETKSPVPVASMVQTRMADAQARQRARDELISATTKAHAAEAIDPNSTRSERPSVLPTLSSPTSPTGAEAVRSTGLSLSMTHPNWGAQFAERVTWLVQGRATAAEIRLNPEHLGPIELSIEVDADEARIQFSAANAITRDAIEQQLPRLRELLEQQGMKLGDADIGDLGKRAGQQHDETAIERLQQSDELADGDVEPPIASQPVSQVGVIDTYA